MNLEQLQYICAIYETGSINQAAKRLFVSQPSISSAVRKLEQELDFDILVRTSGGVQFTERGLALVRYAKRIAEDCSAISSMSDQAQHRFRVLAPRYSPLENAFTSLCAELMDGDDFEKYDMALLSTDWEEALTTLSENRAELFVGIMPGKENELARLREQLNTHGLVLKALARLPLSVKLSKTHPLLQEDPFPFDKLVEYPMVEYRRDPNLPPPVIGMQQLPFAFPRSHIRMDIGNMRTQFIARTKAWGVCAKLPPSHEEKNGVRYIDIPDTCFIIGYLRDPRRPVTPLEKRFLALLKEELSFLQPA